MAFNLSPMRNARSAIALDPRSFGRARPWLLEPAGDASSWSMSEDLKLFASTFAAGFLFVSIVIG